MMLEKCPDASTCVSVSHKVARRRIARQARQIAGITFADAQRLARVVVANMCRFGPHPEDVFWDRMWCLDPTGEVRFKDGTWAKTRTFSLQQVLCRMAKIHYDLAQHKWIKEH